MITDTLKITLANHIESSLIVLGFHWNIEGPDFDQYHSLFASIYDLYYSQIDSLGEYIRILSNGKDYANASVDIVNANKTVKSKLIVGSKPVEMCTAILALNKELLGNYQELFDLAIENNQQGFSDYCAAQLDTLNKLNWKLVSITK